MLSMNDRETLGKFLQSNYNVAVKLFIDDRVSKLKDKIANIPIRTNEDIYLHCELKGEIRALKNLISSIEESITDFKTDERKD